SVVGVTTVVDDADRVLTPEMTGNAKIYCGERRTVDLLTRRRIVDVLTHRLARFPRVEVWPWWWAASASTSQVRRLICDRRRSPDPLRRRTNPAPGPRPRP